MREVRLVAVAAAMVAVSATGGALPGRADTVRRGLAWGQLARVVPYVGIPGVAAGVGVAQAEVDGDGARSSAGVADFGALAMLLGAAGSVAPVPAPELPGPVSADSRGTNDVERNPLPVPAEAGGGAAGVPAPAYEEAHATAEPASRSRARGPELGVPGLFTVTGGESRAEASSSATRSTVTVGQLVLGGGAVPEVVLSDLVWTAGQEMGQPGVASFSIGSVTVAGQRLTAAGDGSADAALGAVNEALTPAGLRLDAPAVTGGAAGASVSSLVLQVRNPETAAGLLREAAKPVTPVLTSLVDSLLAAAPDAAAARLVVNALLATATGRGGGRLELGGASARLGTVEVAAPAPTVPPVAPEVTGLPSLTIPAAAPVPVPLPIPEPLPELGADAPVALGAPPANPAPPGAARTTAVPAAPGGSNVTALPTGAAAAGGGAPAPVVLGTALLAVAILALSDKLRLRRAGADGTDAP